MIYSVDKDKARWRWVDGEVVLLHAETSFYYNLNDTGSFLWQLLSEAGRSKTELVKALAERHRLADEAVVLDVEALLGELIEEGLVKAERE